VRLQSLQVVFSEVCNALSPVVQQQRCWNRVTLHHLMYRVLRERFPEMGSQMVCNAIYSVCRAARLVYQHPQSPFNVGRSGGAGEALPRLMFAVSAPVYFDRHTLSVKDGRLSMYTLDGRMHFDLALEPQQLALFGRCRLLEVVLQGAVLSGYRLSFEFETVATPAVSPTLKEAGMQPELPVEHVPPHWPPYLQVETAT